MLYPRFKKIRHTTNAIVFSRNQTLKKEIQKETQLLEFQRFDFCGSEFEKEPMLFGDELTIQFLSDEMFEGFGWQLQIECRSKIIIMLGLKFKLSLRLRRI